jgi:hypothetical protein
VFPIDCEQIVAPYNKQNGFLNASHLSINIRFLENGGLEIIKSHLTFGFHV